MQFLEVVDTVLDEAGQRNRGEIADSDLIGCAVLDDLRAQVGRFDRAQVLLVGFA